MKVRKYVVYTSSARDVIFVCLKKEQGEFERKVVNVWGYNLEDFDVENVISEDGVGITINTSFGVV